MPTVKDVRKSVRFRVKEPIYGVSADTMEIAVELKQDNPIVPGEDLLVSRYPVGAGSAFVIDNYADREYLENLGRLAAGRGPSRIVGWTRTLQDAPLDKVTVRIVGEGTKYEILSGPAGTFEFTDVRPGTYKVTGVRSGYEIEDSTEVEVVAGGCGAASLVFRF